MGDDPPTVGYDAGYIAAYGADDTSPERALWLAVLVQAANDLFGADEQNRQDAVNFFMGDDLIEVLTYAGISTSCAPAARERARAIYRQSGRRRGVRYRGEVHTVKEWARITSLTADTITGRLRMGWPVEQALTEPVHTASGHSRKRKIRPVHSVESPHS